MMLEIEKKAHLSNPQDTLEKIKVLPNVQHKGFFYKSDLYFTKTQVQVYEDIKNQKTIFRVRYIGEDIYLTLKYKTLSGNTEVNEEIEVLVKEENIKELLSFLTKIEIPKQSPFEGLIAQMLKMKEPEAWVVFWSELGFTHLLNKEKKTELFLVEKEAKQLLLEWNEITNLGFFIEIEGLTQKEEEVQDYISLIDYYMGLLEISQSMEEPKLYIELLFQKYHEQENNK